MANVEPEEQDEKPLDPVMERVRRKMVRLQIVSAGIMFISLMAVLAAVVYKVSGTSAAKAPAANTAFAVPSDQPLTTAARLPTGFEVEQASTSGAQITLLGRIGSARKIIIYDLTVGRVVADVTLTNQ